MIDDRDELIERVARALKPVPARDAGAVARVLGAVRRRRSPRNGSALLDWMRRPTLSVAGAGLLAAAALAIGFVTRGALSNLNDEPAIEAAAAHPVPVIAAARTSDAVREVPVPITFDAPGARHVSIIGDFNDWDGEASPLARFGAGGPWTTTVRVSPGRHLYAFLVDGKLVSDPRASQTPDPDFGGDASVLMVTAP